MKNSFFKIACLLMLLLGGLSTAQAAEDVTMTLSTETQRFTPGKDYEINVDVTNNLTVKALQGDIVFPKGLTAVKSDVENGYFEVSSRIPHSANSSMDVKAAMINDSTLRFLVLPARGREFMPAGEGTILTFKVHASDALATKSTILLDNARATTTTGDDNISNKLDEVTLLVKNTKFVPELILSINDIDVNVNKPVAVPVLLTNEPAYYGEDIDSLTALQFDVQVPEGASINTDDIVYSNRLQQSHIVAVTKMEGNTYRFMVSSSSLGKIRGNKGELFAFYMTTTNTVPEESVLKVTNQVFSTVHGQRYVSDNADLAPDFDVKVTNHRNIYDLNNDGVVNASDIQILLNAFHAGDVNSTMDLNNDGVINANDIQIELNGYHAE